MFRRGEMCKFKKEIVSIGLLLLIGAHSSLAQWANICSDAEDGTRLALPLDCARFAVCEDREVAQIRRCPRGLHFNSELGECDFQWRAVCTGLLPFGKAVADEDCVCTCCAEQCPDEPSVPEQTTPCQPVESTTKPTGPTSSPDIGVTETVPDETTSEGETTYNTEPAPGPSPTDSPVAPPGGGGDVPAFCVDKRPDCVNQPDGALLQLPGVCTKFIQCNHGCSTEQICPSGLYFDPIEGICNYPWDVDCKPVSTDDNDGEVVGPSGTTCSDQGICAGQRDGKMFADPDTNGYFVCQCQCPIAMPCDANTKFNEAAQVCDWDNVPNTDGGSDGGSGGSGGSGGGSGSSAVICPDGLIYNATSDQCDYAPDYVPDVVCPNTETICQNQPEGELFPINGVCNKFYKCNFNCAIEQICPNNLLYDAKTKICDYPQNVKCEWPYSPPTGPEAGPSGISCESNGRCLGQREGTYFPSLTSCSGYVVCQCECEVPMECSPGLYWDTKLSTCNYPDKAGCSPYLLFVAMALVLGAVADDDCCEVGDTKPDENDCTQYYGCCTGKFVLKSCPSGQYWNRDTKQCEDDNGQCVTVAPCTCTDGDVKADDSDCTKYLVCKNGEYVSASCNSGDYWNAASKQCEQDNGQCVTQASCTNGDTQADASDCTKYLVCQNGQYVSASCNSGDYWNTASKQCEQDNGQCVSVGCKDGVLKPDESNCAGFYECVDNKFVQRKCPAQTYFDNSLGACVIDENGVCIPKVCDAECCDMPNNWIGPVDKNCSAFIQCLYGNVIQQNCPNNLQFNNITKECDYPDVVQCDDGSPPPSGPTAGPSGTYCESKGRCLGKRDGTMLVDDKNKCSGGYIVCQCECEVAFTCSAGLVFNQQVLACDWPDNSDC
ncbi:PREDICTED: multiple epidermal growth factor-like domains protein 10 [Drosophila arizonae]|uniref:Multiple epidermal growth factor-like domains protein 10 n=1 Tax=Drosophila arizonae TaxID=7263 RepID=A0ABM1P0K7_DROAR|nr:PREDICTED: multiple epidermal growth factor-like domains protein 10 [Drosophila arizonae]